VSYAVCVTLRKFSDSRDEVKGTRRARPRFVLKPTFSTGKKLLVRSNARAVHGHDSAQSLPNAIWFALTATAFAPICAERKASKIE